MEVIDGRLKFFMYSITFTMFLLLGGLYLCQIYHGDKFFRLANNNNLRVM